VLVQKHTPGPGTLPADAGPVAYDGTELRLVDLGQPAVATPPTAAKGWAAPLLALDAGLLGLVVGGALAALRELRRAGRRREG